jgi:CHAT domain-containing protein
MDAPATPITLTDKVALRDLAYDLTIKGKCNQAVQPLEAALALYKQERGQQKTWKILRDGYLIDELNILNRLAFCYHQLEDYERLLQTFRSTHEVRTLLQQIEYLQGFTIPPSDPVKQALEQFFMDWHTRLASDLSKISFLEKGQPFFQTLIESFVELQQYDQALLVAEQGRARALVDLLAAKFDRSTADPPSLAQIQQIAQEHNATLVQYSLVPDKDLFIWVIHPDGKIDFHKTELSQSKTPLAALVTDSRAALGVRGYGRADIEVAMTPEAAQQQKEKRTRNLRQLHQLLIEPIATLLPTDQNQRVIFIPQNELFLVPFPALLDAKGEALIEQHTILTAPSIQVLDLTWQKRKKVKGQESAARGALIVGNPKMPRIVTRVGDDPVQLSDLPGAKQEAIEIAKLFNTQAITGAQATEPAIAQQMPTARFIHLATHGLLSDFKGLGVPGAIALAPVGNGQLNDGLLTADKILDMKLNAELVVLSACDTGRGKITGDGVIGLSRSLISAGVPSIIVSLWKVPDESTRFLMTQFYQNLQKMPDKAQALRQAMLKTKQTYPEPLNWSAFTLIGEAE